MGPSIRMAGLQLAADIVASSLEAQVSHCQILRGPYGCDIISV